MMKKATYIFLTAAVLLAAACQSEILPEGEVPGGESILCFQPALGGAIGTKSNVDNGSLTDSDSATPSTVAELVATDGSIAIPLTCTVSDGIGEPAAPQTKGSQMNTSGDWDALGEYVDNFYVAAWKGNTSFVPANTVVTKTTPLWQTSTAYRWEATEDATFYAYANLPESGATVTQTQMGQILTYSVPAASSDQTDILMGYYSGKPKYDATLHKGGIAEVKFYHPLTAVRFKMGTFIGATSVQFKSISINGVYTGGMATMTPTTMGESETDKYFNWIITQPTPRKVTMSPASGETYLSVDANGFIGDAFLLIPQTMTTAKPVKISITAYVDGVEKKFDAKLTDNSWQAGKTNVYTLGYLNIPDGALPGAFSVSPTKKVYFSKGNLQAKYLGESEHYSWNFAENQYDFIGNAPGNTRVSSLVSGDVVDLFRWSFTTNYYGIEGNDTTGTFKDWGIALGTSSGIATDIWRTLSQDEYKYLFWNSRDGDDDVTRKGLYACGVTVVGHKNCIVLYPDGYVGAKVENGDTESYDTLEEWNAAEKTGVVCLPAAGWRGDNIVRECNVAARYWLSSSASSDNQPYAIGYDAPNMKFSLLCSPAFGFAVRLVTDAN